MPGGRKYVSKYGGIGMNIENNIDALTMALALAISAPDENRAAECIAMAESIANNGMTIEQVTACKLAAEKIVGLA